MTGLGHFATFETFFNEFCMRPSGHNATQFHLPLNLKKFLTTFKATLSSRCKSTLSNVFGKH